MKVKLFFLALISLLIISCSHEQVIDDVNVLTSKSSDMNNPAIQVADNLMKSFQSGVTRSTQVVYPDYFGGLYFDKANNLVILVKNDDISRVRKDIIKRGQGDSFDIVKCSNSYNELLNVAKILDSYLLNESSWSETVGLTGFSILDDKNIVEVSLRNISEEKIKEVQSKIGVNNLVRFVKSENIVQESKTLTYGQPMYYVSFGSIGFRAKRSIGHMVPVNGFVVSGHVAKTNGAEIYENGTSMTSIGKVEALKIGGNVDAAFCHFLNGYQLSNKLYSDFTYVNSNLGSLYVGTPVGLRGKNTASRGTIISTYATLKYSGSAVTLVGVMTASYSSTGGDSGGIIYTTNGMQIAGIHIAGPETGTGVRYFSPASAIIQEFGLQLY